VLEVGVGWLTDFSPIDAKRIVNTVPIHVCNGAHLFEYLTWQCSESFQYARCEFNVGLQSLQFLKSLLAEKLLDLLLGKATHEPKVPA
jgi:hypothetical protein